MSTSSVRTNWSNSASEPHFRRITPRTWARSLGMKHSASRQEKFFSKRTSSSESSTGLRYVIGFHHGGQSIPTNSTAPMPRFLMNVASSCTHHRRVK